MSRAARPPRYPKVEITNLTTLPAPSIARQAGTTTMGYINDFRAKLQALIEEGKEEEAVKFAADTVLESYRNGLELGAKADKADVRKAERFAKRAQKNAGR